MDTFSSDIELNNNSIKADVGIVIAVLESGNSVELKATGYSMFPTLRPGDSVVVKPLDKGELPVPGNVVVYIENGLKAQRRNGITEEKRNGVKEEKHISISEERHNGITAQRRNGITEERHNDITTEHHNSILVMHRLVEIKDDDSGNSLLITRGDSGMENDKPCPQQQFLGVAVSYKRGEKEHLVKTFILGEWRYKYNRRLLWIFNKINRLKRILVSGSKFKV